MATPFIITDDATEAETAELAAEQRELAQVRRDQEAEFESDTAFTALLAEWHV